MSRIIVDGVTAGYGAVTVLRDVSLEVGAGELVALLGVNGNGKSTLAELHSRICPAAIGPNPA